MESIIPNRNVGKMDPISVVDLLSPLITGEKLISRNGINQLKIECQDCESANRLILCGDLLIAGYQLFIPKSFLRKKGFTTDYPPTWSIEDISEKFSLEEAKDIISITRIVNPRGLNTDRVEFTFDLPTIPKNIKMGGCIIKLIPVVFKPRRCYRCQRFCYVATQCRSTYPFC